MTAAERPSTPECGKHDGSFIEDLNESSPNREVVRMFEEISPTYDSLNRLLSAGRDSSWRRHAVAALDIRASQTVLDCAAGTGDVSIEILRQVAAAHVVLLDPAENMLARARVKLKLPLHTQVQMVQGNAEALPFASGSFDRFIVAFGLRNFLSPDIGLCELLRIIRQGGKGAILEFTPDRHPAFRRFFRFYFMYVIRPIGALISRHAFAYEYLGRSIDGFFTSPELREHLTRAGWTIDSHRRFAGGVVSLFVVHK